jgi:hypothetical protein
LFSYLNILEKYKLNRSDMSRTFIVYEIHVMQNKHKAGENSKKRNTHCSPYYCKNEYFRTLWNESLIFRLSPNTIERFYFHFSQKKTPTGPVFGTGATRHKAEMSGALCEEIPSLVLVMFHSLSTPLFYL